MTGCDRCVSEGIVCRRDSKPQQRAGGGKATTRRNEANKAAQSSENTASRALGQKSPHSQTSNGIRTPESVTPTLASGTSSVYSVTGELPTPISAAHSEDGSNDIWQVPSLASGNVPMTPSLGVTFNPQDFKWAPGPEDFVVDPEFDAFGLEQDRNVLVETTDLDFSFDDIVSKDDREISGVERSPAPDGGVSRRVASPLTGRKHSRAHHLPSNPSQSQWNNFNRFMSVSSSSRVSTQRPKNEPRFQPTQCDCLAVTLSLLEKVYFQDTRVSLSSWIGLLHKFKQWMRLFQGVTGCTTCRCATNSLMLLVVVCEKLGDSFEVILSIYKQLAEALIQKPGGDTSDMHLLSGGYSVDCIEEFTCLSRCLALRHLNFLYRIIVLLDEKALRQGLQTHHESLQRQIDKLSLIKDVLSQAHLQEARDRGRQEVI